MPFIPLSQRSFGYRLRLEPTIPLAFYPDRSTIYYQIINPDLYDFLASNLPNKLLPKGDFFLDDDNARTNFDLLVDLFYL